MTSGEQKIFDALMEVKAQQAVFISRQETLEKRVENHSGHIETMKADRNKFLGAAWLGGSLGGLGFLGGIGAFISSLLKH